MGYVIVWGISSLANYLAKVLKYKQSTLAESTLTLSYLGKHCPALDF